MSLINSPMNNNCSDSELNRSDQMPLVSFVVLTYNQARFAEDTLAGALSQDYPDLEIIVSDDASKDGTFDVMQDYMLRHPSDKNVRLNRNETNMGLVPHLNYVMRNLVHGEIVVLAGGDDISMPNRVRDSVAFFNSNGSIMVVTGQAVIIDKDGVATGEKKRYNIGLYSLDDRYIRSISFMCGGMGVAFRKKEVWDEFGELHPLCPTEDSTIRFRSLLRGQIAVSDNVFIKYRIHGNNISGPQNIHKLSAKEISRQYLRDLDVAKRLSLVSRTDLKRLRKKARLNCYNRKLLKEISRNTNRYCRAPFKIMLKFVRKKAERL